MGQVMEDLVFQHLCQYGQLQILLGLLPEIATKSENDKILHTKVPKGRQPRKLFLNPFLFIFISIYAKSYKIGGRRSYFHSSPYPQTIKF